VCAFSFSAGLARSARPLCENSSTVGTMSGPWRGPAPRRQSSPHPARRSSRVISLRPSDGHRGFRTSTRSFTPRAISAPRWGRSIAGCSTCCCPRSPLVHSEDLASLHGLVLEHNATRSSYIGAAIEGLEVGRIARAFAKRFGTRHHQPEIISIDAIAAELGEWRGVLHSTSG
jgi:hypothetical protein